MKKVIICLMGIIVLCLLILTGFNSEAVSKPELKYCWTLKPGGEEPCWDKPTNCFCPIIVTPDGTPN